MKLFLYISAFVLCLALAACGNNDIRTEYDYSFIAQTCSEDHGNLEQEQILYLKQWERVIENDEFAVKLYKPYKVSEVYGNPVWSSSLLPRAGRHDTEELPLPTPEWYDNAKTAIEFLRRYNLEFVPVDTEITNIDALILNFYSGGDGKNILELDVMIHPDGTVVIRDRQCNSVLQATEKIAFEQFSSLAFKDTVEIAPLPVELEQWDKVINKNTWIKLYPPYKLESETLMSTPPNAYKPTWEWYDLAQKAIGFFRSYNLKFETQNAVSSHIYGIDSKALVFNFYSGTDENVLELRVIVDPDGTVIIDATDFEERYHSTTKVDFEALQRTIVQRTQTDN